MAGTDQTTNTNGLPRIDRPCPHWCELPAGHGWDSEDLHGLVEIRGHGLTIGTTEGEQVFVSIGNLESSTVGDVSTFSPVVITVDTASGAELNQVQAKDLADLLNMAAEKVASL